ncbi:MAG: cation diffusion facilitator family transporter, partial [Nitrospirae bacterium]|nr:cation diffusion facilitator family transporter [Nitrospirota bacterium]
MDRSSKIRRVLIITLLLNIVVSAVKVVYGYIANSVAIISDGFHSFFDGISNVVGLVSIYFSSHPPDERHPYGHRKFETVSTIFIGLLMFMTCIEIFKKVYNSLSGGREAVVTEQAFIVMLGTLIVNIFVTRYEGRMGQRLNSEYLIADASHTKTDIYVSISVIAGLILVRLGFPVADPIIGALVGALVAKVGIEVIKDSAAILVDSSNVDTEKIKGIVMGIKGVEGCHDIRARGTKGNIFIDLHILVEPLMTVKDAHSIADDIEEAIKNRMPEAVDVVV